MMLVVWLLIAGAALATAAPRHKRQASRGPLYDYVHADDGMYTWAEYSMVSNNGVTTYFLNMTSQQWYDETLSNRPIWWHYVTIHVPDTNRFPDSAFLFIGKGRNTDNLPTIDDGQIKEMGDFARQSGIVTGHVKTIPNQAIIMENDGVSRVEDEYIAWTWKRFYDEKVLGIDNPQILARMPMCKGSVRAMDAMQEFMQSRFSVAVENFMIAGQSKRGWTTWLTAAVDDRVIAMAPVVLSCLNMQENFHHYWKSLGGWSFALYDYWSFGIMGLIDEPEMTEMAKIIDPYAYRQWLTMPKLMISGASDEFFMPDDYDYFFDDLLGEKYIWILENSGHEVAGSDLGDEYWAMLEAFYVSVLQNYQRPSLDWAREYTSTGGSIVLLSPTKPLNVSTWSAMSIAPDRRDFRSAHIQDGTIEDSGVLWVESPVEDLGNGYYRAQFNNPAVGFQAFFIKMIYQGPEGRLLYFTTETAIIPNVFPHADCSGQGCFGTLL